MNDTVVVMFTNGGPMKRMLFCLLLTFLPMYGMQHYQCKVIPKSNSAPQIMICEPMHDSLHEQARRLSEERDKRRYKRKVKIALISLVGSVVGGLTALVVYLTK